MKTTTVLGCAASLWACTVAAADKLHFAPAPAWVEPVAIPSAGAPTPTPLRILLLDRQFHFSRGTEELYAENAVRIQTPQGLGAIGTITLAWNPDTDVVTVHRVHVLRNGKVIDILGAGQTFTIARRESNLEYAALDGTLTAILQPAGLEVGDTVDFAYTLARTDPALPGLSEGEVSGFGLTAISRLHVRALWPSSLPMRWAASDGLPGVRQTHAGSVTTVSVEWNDVQPVVEPRGAPARYLLDPRIEFSSFSSWGELAGVLAPIFERAERLPASSPLIGQIARIRSATADPKARAALALALVENQIRYVYLGMNDGGIIPARPDLTWSRRFGDCKAKSVLLVALLRALGIDAVPVAVNVKAGALLQGRLPMVELLDHVLVRATIAGKTYWLDGTRLGDHSLDDLAVPYYHWGLPLTAAGSGLVRLEPAPAKAPLLETTVQIDASAGITMPAPFHVETLMRGDAGTALKLRLASLQPNQLTEALRNYWSQIYGFVQIKSVAAAYDEHSAQERLTMDGTAQMDWGGDQYESDGMRLGYQADFERTPGPNHDAPFAVPFPLYTRFVETIRLPDDGIGFTTDGADIDRTVAGVEYHRHARIDKGVFHGEATQRSLEPQFPFSEAAAAQQALRAMAKSALYVEAPRGYSPTKEETAAGVPAKVSDAAGLIKRATLLVGRKQYDAAIQDLNAALALEPRASQVIVYRGISYLMKRDITDARRDIEAAYAIAPHDSYVLDARGMLAMASRDTRTAISEFDSASKVNAKDDFALKMRTLAEMQAGGAGGALADLDRAIEQHPQDPKNYAMRAALLQREHKTAAALEQAKRVIEADPRDGAAYLTAGEIYWQLDHRRQARAAFDRAVAVAPTEAAYLARAQHRPTSDSAGRRADMEAAVRLNPDSTADLQGLAGADVDSGRYDDAVTAATKAMKLGGASMERLTLRAIGYAKSGRGALARADLVRARSLAQSAQDKSKMCWTMATAGVALPSALELCDAAVAEGTGRAKGHYLDNRGFVLLKLKRCKEALAAYDEALKIEPLLPTALYGRGICELRDGDARTGHADMKDAQLFSDGVVADEFERAGVRP